MAKRFLLIISMATLFCLPSIAKSPDPDCVDWFRAAKQKAGNKDCELKCASLMTDMATFICPNQCEDLCKASENSSYLWRLLYYPGLTPAEKKLVEKYPKDAIIVFVQKTRAEWSSSRNFPDQGINDESDAFRHFVWAGLLTRELGAEKAKEFLDAHEANRLQEISEKNMDVFNNQKGQQSAEQLISEKRWSQKELESEGLKALREKRLNVLNPRLSIPEVPK